MSGARKAQNDFMEPDLNKNDCYEYCGPAERFCTARGKRIEVLVSYEPCFTLMNEWWKQLYGESEGKDQKGPVPGLCGLFSRISIPWGSLSRTASACCLIR